MSRVILTSIRLQDRTSQLLTLTRKGYQEASGPLDLTNCRSEPSQYVNMKPVEWLMAWYRSQCNGDWEHQNGVRIGTIDNPGWSLDVDLAETAYAGRPVAKKMIERSEADWVFVEVKDDSFRARGGPGNLVELIDLFNAFVEGRPMLE